MKTFVLSFALLFCAPIFAAPTNTSDAALKQTLAAVKSGDRKTLAALVSKEGLRLVQTYANFPTSLKSSEKDEALEAGDNPREIDSLNRFLNRKQALAAIQNPKNSRFAMLLTGKAFVAEGGQFYEMRSLAPRDFAALKWTKKGNEFFAQDKGGANYYLKFSKENGFKLRAIGYYWPLPAFG